MGRRLAALRSYAAPGGPRRSLPRAVVPRRRRPTPAAVAGVAVMVVAYVRVGGLTPRPLRGGWRRPPVDHSRRGWRLGCPRRARAQQHRPPPLSRHCRRGRRRWRLED
ncbi:hypothetical protein I4F81_003439 [Pyropia yezoensis]|uniref:Uncharacterized protein n=1 Tax=Pyropia yezoensis TaxID=2788 RepID=A0ACC3BSH0_PYRYE|nr:hypothetical protein I4F81_003439 [Neopyropia yezoensis]